MDKGPQVLDRDDYNRLQMEVDRKRDWKIGKYTYDTAPRSFYHWATWQPNKSRSLILFIQWYKMKRELDNSVDGGDPD